MVLAVEGRDGIFLAAAMVLVGAVEKASTVKSNDDGREIIVHHVVIRRRLSRRTLRRIAVIIWRCVNNKIERTK